MDLCYVSWEIVAGIFPSTCDMCVFGNSSSLSESGLCACWLLLLDS